MEWRKINGAVFTVYRFARQGCPNVTLRHTQRYRPQAALQKIQKDDVSAAQVETPHLAGRLPQGRPGAKSVAGIERYLAGLTGAPSASIHRLFLPRP
jgi:hypothetical protein